MSKLAVVTGATGGLGSVLVTTLLTAGYDLIACGRNEARLTALTQWHTAPSRFVMPWVCDLATATPEALADDLQRLTPVAYARVSLLVCAHGAPPCLTPTLDLTVNEVERIYRTDVLGTLLMAQVVGAGMVERREGAMVFVSSAHATQTYPARAPYAMAKASVCSLARALAVEWGHANVRVNSVSPWQCAGPTRSTAVAAQEEAQTVVDRLAPKVAERVAAQQAEMLAQAETTWKADTAADKEIGGDALSVNLGVARKALDAFGTPELRALLEGSRLGNHPEVIRFMVKAGKAISEDRMVTGGAGPKGEQTTASKLYSKQS